MFSVNQAISEGAKIRNEGKVYILSYAGQEICFDYEMRTRKGYVMCAIIYPTGIYDKVVRGIETKEEMN